MGRFKLAAVLLAVTANPTTAIKSLFGRDLDPVTAFEGAKPACATSICNIQSAAGNACARRCMAPPNPPLTTPPLHRVHGGPVLGL